MSDKDKKLEDKDVEVKEVEVKPKPLESLMCPYKSANKGGEK